VILQNQVLWQLLVRFDKDAFVVNRFLHVNNNKINIIFSNCCLHVVFSSFLLSLFFEKGSRVLETIFDGLPVARALR
jgi:hypothetical protein